MPHIVLDQITKSFGVHQVLPPLDLDLDDGEFTVLVGPSGCGKSTTLRILAGLELPSSGEIYFDDQPISALEPKDRDVAMVFQDYALYPHMNVAKNMSFALRLARVPKAEIDEKVKQVAALLNIQDYLHRKPAELSGGQRQRVAMGRVLVRDAGTFLFDEPLSNLDAQLRAKMRTELAEMRDKIDKNMIYVTHDQTEAMTLGDRIVVMKGGVIQQQGTPEALFKRPANKFVAGFIGSPPMNFLHGELSETNGSLHVRGDGFDLPLNDEQRSRLETTSRPVEIGIRPSAFSADSQAGAPIDLHLIVSEYLGAHSVLVTRCGVEDVLVEYDSATPMKAGTTMTFGVRSDDIMLFDVTTGVTL
ncbi:MAG: ATP-binding cassette domain-containing protein [Pseudomonadota bacterium]